MLILTQIELRAVRGWCLQTTIPLPPPPPFCPHIDLNHARMNWTFQPKLLALNSVNFLTGWTAEREGPAEFQPEGQPLRVLPAVGLPHQALVTYGG